MSLDAMVPAHVVATINAQRESPFELSERESQLLGRFTQVMASSRAKDPTVTTTPETMRFVLDYVKRTQAWHAGAHRTTTGSGSDGRPSCVLLDRLGARRARSPRRRRRVSVPALHAELRVRRLQRGTPMNATARSTPPVQTHPFRTWTPEPKPLTQRERVVLVVVREMYESTAGDQSVAVTRAALGVLLGHVDRLEAERDRMGDHGAELTGQVRRLEGQLTSTLKGYAPVIAWAAKRLKCEASLRAIVAAIAKGAK